MQKNINPRHRAGHVISNYIKHVKIYKFFSSWKRKMWDCLISKLFEVQDDGALCAIA
jgi:hypothetical protein